MNEHSESRRNSRPPRSPWTCLKLGLLVLAGAAVLGCAEERDPINRVQADAVAKDFFVGPALHDPADDPEFYWRNYVVDGSASQSLIGIGSWSNVERIRWEITQDLLIARKAYQPVQGADDKGLREKDPNGSIVAAYEIQSHFDVRRAYNPSTGEELNVVEENTTDRLWHDRQYMRIDWSKNLVDTPQWLDMFVGKLFGNIKLTPISYYVNDPTHPDAPHFDVEQGYFDITSRYYIEPEDSWYWPGVPTCVVVGFFTGSASYECDPQEATIRSSYLRLDPGHDFERLEITRAPGDIVGNPASIDAGGLLVGLVSPGEQGWDPGYGVTDALYHRFAHIHNIWQQSHIEAPCHDNVDLDNDGTADQCHPTLTGYEGSLGSQCDVFAEQCTIPYRDRQLETVGFWVNDVMPEELLDGMDPSGQPTARGAAEDVIYSWNQLMTGAVAQAREVECRRTGGDRDGCHGAFFDPEPQMVSYGAWLVDQPRDTTEVLTLCHNPVRSYDHETCGAEGYRARLGDIRHNFLAYWPHASRVRWGGIGNWGADPLTGEIRGAAAMIMGRSCTHAAAWQRDVIQVALGDMSIEDVTDGVPAQAYARMLQNGHLPDAMSSTELAHRHDAIDPVHAAQTIAPLPLQGATVAEQYQKLVELQKHSTHDVNALSSAQLEFDALAEQLRGSVYEAELTGGQWMTSIAGLSPETQTTDDVLNGVSPLRGMDPGSLRSMRERIQTLLHMKGYCYGDHEAPVFGSVDLQGLARHFAAKYPDGEYTPQQRGEAIYHDLWIEAFKGIAIHEVGHALGLLHNFASSYDAPNYRPQYWQLRTQEGASTASCQGEPRTGDVHSAASDSCMGPRYLDPETDDEQGLAEETRPGILYFAQTSVMEYSLERFGETIGLGSYDSMAMKALYGRVLETFDDEQHGGMTRDEQLAFAPRLQTQLTEQDRVVRSDGPFSGQEFAKPTHYTELARKMRVFDPARCRPATEQEKQLAQWRLVHGQVCTMPPRDHAAWVDFEDGLTDPNQDWTMATAWQTRPDAPAGGEKVRWHYRYGATNNSYVHTQLTDAGADIYETTVNTVRKFESMYPWAYFRRQNREYFYGALPLSASRRTFERLRAYHWNVANSNAFYRSFGEATWDEIAGSDDWHRPAIVAETEMFNALARSILTPEPGDYSPLANQPVDAERTIWDADGSTFSSFSLGAGDAKFIGQQFNSDPDGGGSWNYLHWMKHAGFGAEKVLAAMALADGRPVLMTISRDNYLDGRSVKINFRNDMPEAMDRLIGGVLAEDWDTVGQWVHSGDPLPSPQMTPLTRVDEPTRPDDALVLHPNVGYKQQLGMLIFAQLYSRMNTDMTLSNKLRLWIDGQEGEITVPEEHQIHFLDPASGYTYIARNYGPDVVDGKSIDRGIASRMLAHANALVMASYEIERTDEGQPLLDEFGAPVVRTDQWGQPILLDPSDSRIGELSRYVGLLDAARQIGRILGYGPLGGPN